ncbi:MAG: branched-chain amino acid ABC transporter permease [Burkholderiaceae bacterium]
MSELISNIALPGTRGFWRRHLVWLMALVLLLLIPQVIGSRVAIAVLNQMAIMVIFTVAYNMLLGQGGMLSFGHAVYFGLGGYFSIHLINAIGENDWAIPIVLVPLIGGLAGLVFAIIFGSFSTNRAGTVFAMISLGIGELIAASSLIFVKFSGGEEGVTGDRTDPPAFLGVDFASEVEVYYLIVAWMMIAVYLMYRFSRTPIGRIANAVRDNPERAQFIGYSQKRVRFISFVVSGMFAGIAGALFAINYEIVTEETVNAITSGVVLLQAYIGGVGFFAGPIVGAVIYTLLQTLLSNYTEIWAFYVGIVFVATVMYAPAGLTGIIMMHQPIWRIGEMRSLIGPYLRVLIPGAVSAIGFIGLLELLHFVSSRGTGESVKNVFGIDFNADTYWPWLLFGALIVIGFWLARQAAPRMVQAYQAALHRAFSGDAA